MEILKLLGIEPTIKASTSICQKTASFPNNIYFHRPTSLSADVMRKIVFIEKCYDSLPIKSVFKLCKREIQKFASKQSHIQYDFEV